MKVNEANVGERSEWRMEVNEANVGEKSQRHSFGRHGSNQKVEKTLWDAPMAVSYAGKVVVEIGDKEPTPGYLCVVCSRATVIENLCLGKARTYDRWRRKLWS